MKTAMLCRHGETATLHNATRLAYAALKRAHNRHLSALTLLQEYGRTDAFSPRLNQATKTGSAAVTQLKNMASQLKAISR